MSGKPIYMKRCPLVPARYKRAKCFKRCPYRDKGTGRCTLEALTALPGVAGSGAQDRRGEVRRNDLSTEYESIKSKEVFCGGANRLAPV
jgi:hypothetical protein